MTRVEDLQILTLKSKKKTHISGLQEDIFRRGIGGITYQLR
jgi:hypothetical protein